MVTDNNRISSIAVLFYPMFKNGIQWWDCYYIWEWCKCR